MVLWTCRIFAEAPRAADAKKVHHRHRLPTECSLERVPKYQLHITASSGLKKTNAWAVVLVQEGGASKVKAADPRGKFDISQISGKII